MSDDYNDAALAPLAVGAGPCARHPERVNGSSFSPTRESTSPGALSTGLSFPRRRESTSPVSTSQSMDSRWRGNDDTEERRPMADGGPEPASGGVLATATVPLATPEQVALKMTNPWVLLKVKALGELIPAAGFALEMNIDRGAMPHEISSSLLSEFNVRLSELEVARYGAWLPRIRRDAMRKAAELSEQRVQEAKQRMKGQRRSRGPRSWGGVGAGPAGGELRRG